MTSRCCKLWSRWNGCKCSSGGDSLICNTGVLTGQDCSFHYLTEHCRNVQTWCNKARAFAEVSTAQCFKYGLVLLEREFTTLNIYIHIKTSRRSIYIHAFKLRPDVTTEQCISVDHSIRKTSLTNAIQASGSWNQRFRCTLSSSSIKNTVSLKLMNCYGAK